MIYLPCREWIACSSPSCSGIIRVILFYVKPNHRRPSFTFLLIRTSFLSVLSTGYPVVMGVGADGGALLACGGTSTNGDSRPWSSAAAAAAVDNDDNDPQSTGTSHHHAAYTPMHSEPRLQRGGPVGGE
jgi:hypothetical protein